MRKLILNLDVPSDVMEAAEKVSVWAKTQGFKDWSIGPVADRDYLERIVRTVNCEDKNEFHFSNYQPLLPADNIRKGGTNRISSRKQYATVTTSGNGEEATRKPDLNSAARKPMQ